MPSLSKAQALAGAGKFGEAESYLREGLTETSDVRNWLVLGRILEQEGKTPEALQLYDIARARLPEHSPGHVFYGIAALDTGDLDAAHEAINQVLARQPANDIALSYAALIALRRGDDERGLAIFREHGITDNRAFRVRLTEWMESEWLKSGRFFGPRALEIGEIPAKGSARRAQKHFYAKRYVEMLRELDGAAHAEFPDQSVLFACAIGCEMLFDYERALDYLGRAREPDSDWPDTLIATRGRNLIRMGDFTDGASDLGRVMMVGPEDFGCNYYLGVLCLAHGEQSKARQLFARAHTQYLIDTLEFQYWQIERALGL
jgi:tetratricopeptide (TPR) repeat protein